jgi:cytochrome P450
LKLAQNPGLQEDLLSGNISIMCLIVEGIRMMPAAGFIARIVKKDLTMVIKNKKDGSEVRCRLPMDMRVVPAPTIAGRDPNVITADGDLEEFNPYRWKEMEDAGTLKQFLPDLEEYPFGLGCHPCPASRLAKLEIATFITELNRRFVMKTEFKGEPKQLSAFTTRPYGKLNVTFELR